MQMTVSAPSWTLDMQEVFNVQFAACMNPTAGSFSITPRMQRHFATFALQMPGADVVRCGHGLILTSPCSSHSLFTTFMT